MKKHFQLAVLLLLVAGSLACQAVTRAFLPPTPAPTEEALGQTLPALNSPTLVSPSPSLVPPSSTPQPTDPPASPTPARTYTPAASPTTQITPSALQLSVFEDLWKTVRDNYLYTDFNGLDWDAMHAEYQAKIEAGLSPADFYMAMSELIVRLGDDHSSYLSPDAVAEEEREFSGENNYVGIGITTTAVPERNRVTTITVFPGSPAEEAGLQPHDSILAIDGQQVLDGETDRRSLMKGEEGSEVTITVQTPGQEPRELTLIRRRVTGAVPVPYTLLKSENGQRIGYIFLPNFADDTVAEQVGKALQELSKGGRLDGLILDNRMNYGGQNTVTRDTLGYFTSGIVGYFVNREGKKAFKIPGNDINGSTKVPLVVLVGKGSISFGEIFSGILKDIGRAKIVGEATDGNVEIEWGYDFEDGSRLWLAHDTFQPLKHPDQDWEQTGIIPDLTVTSNWDEVTLDTDPVVQEAQKYLEEGQKP